MQLEQLHNEILIAKNVIDKMLGADVSIGIAFEALILSKDNYEPSRT